MQLIEAAIIKNKDIYHGVGQLCGIKGMRDCSPSTHGGKLKKRIYAQKIIGHPLPRPHRMLDEAAFQIGITTTNH